MDGSIFVVGESQFLERFSSLVADYGYCKPDAASDLTAAISSVQAHVPDLVLLQANPSSNLDLCRIIKTQSHLNWIYIVAVIPVCSRDWLNAQAVQSQLSHEKFALESGADAVVWWLKSDLNAVPCSPRSQGEGGLPMVSAMPSWHDDHEHPPHAQHTSMDGGVVTQQLTRVNAETLQQVCITRLKMQLQVGIRRVHNHRELMRQNDLLSAIALSDPLTELNNRRAFEWELPRKIQNARHRQAPLSLLVLDVDYFKSINDNYGHLAGDRALQLLSARLRHHLRFCDTPFRYGGEEFVVILSDTDTEEAVQIGHRLCCRIAEKPFALSDVLDVQITISIGSASLLPSDDERGMSLINRADRYLFVAKSQGRNQVVSCHDVGSFSDESINGLEQFL